ncbi:MAG: cupredoxin family copper-binding protein [Terriglobales bacterium]|jgi:plastocyanin
MRTRQFSAALFAILMLLGASISGTAAAVDTATVAVQIDNFSFTPQEIKVKAGTTITWTNHDDIPHTVVSTDEAFKSRALDTDDKFTATLTKPGTYAYFCSIHPKMTGKIVVE